MKNTRENGYISVKTYKKENAKSINKKTIIKLC